MYILGYDWFELVRQYYELTDIEKRNLWTGKQETAYGLGIFVWIIIAFVSLIVLLTICIIIASFFIELNNYEFKDIKNALKTKFKKIFKKQKKGE